MYELTVRGERYRFPTKEKRDHLKNYIDGINMLLDSLVRERNDLQEQLQLRDLQLAMNNDAFIELRKLASQHYHGQIVCMSTPCAIQDCERVRRVRKRTKRSLL